MAVERVEIRERGPFWRGYERLDGVIHFAADPEDPCDAVVVDLDRAPRSGDRRVHFEADFCLLQPERPAGRLLVLVVNRGRTSLVPFSLPGHPPSPEPTHEIDPGDAFLLRRGWSVLFCGWQWDVVARPGLLGLRAPLADVPPGEVMVRIQPYEPHDERLVSHWPLDPAPHRQAIAHRGYPPVAGPATLTVSDGPEAPAVVVPPQLWRFSGDGTRLDLEGGFEPGRIYDLVYQTALAPVVGCGLLAVRDAAAHFGRDAAATFGHGVSQTGRFLRHFLFAGMNRIGDGGAAFQGLLPHVAGARRGEFNHRFAQPSVQHAPSFGHLPPFDTSALLERAGVPVKVVETNSSSEYWRSDASLAHSTHPDLRQYLFSGTMHVPGVPALLRQLPTMAAPPCANPVNTVDWRPLLRAALVNLEAWVCEGVEPPASRVPASTAAPEEVLRRLAGVPASLPDPSRLPVLHELDLGPEVERGIGRYPPRQGRAIPSTVPDLDEDGNEREGVRLPDLAVPLATHTGWNPATTAPGVPMDMLGSTIPFWRTAGERDARHDPRPSIAERYRSREDYLQRVEDAAGELVAGHLLLAEDVPVVLGLAGESWDLLAG